MKIGLSIDVENYKARQSLYSVGIPSPTTVLSFIENLLIKSNFVDPKKSNYGVSVAYGIRKFEYSKKKFVATKVTTFNDSTKPINKNILEDFRANISIQMIFDIETDMGEKEVRDLLYETCLFLRFSGGYIKKINIFSGEKYIRPIFPTFMVYDNKDELNNIEDLANEILNNKYVVTKGYGLLSEISDNTSNAETLIGLVELKALRKSNIDKIHFWKFINDENTIQTKGE